MLFLIRQCVTIWALYLLTTLLCGTAAWIIWAPARRLLRGRGVASVFRAAGRLTEWLYVLPLVHIGWKIYTTVATEFRLFFGRTTPTIEKVLLALTVFWLPGFLWAVRRRLNVFLERNRLCGACVPCTGERAELFRRACWRCGIVGEILPYQGECVTEPFLRGLFARRMYLPAGEISQEEMQHLLRKYRWSGRCMAAVELYTGLIHWYNPLVKSLCRCMEEDAGSEEREKTVGAGIRGCCTALALAVQLAFAGFCALQFLEGYTRLDTLTSDVIEMEGEESEPPEEYVVTEEESDIVTEDDVVEINEQDGSYNVRWCIHPRTRKQSPSIYGETGETISVLVITSDDISYKCGIMYEDGTRQYSVSDNGGLCTFFTLRKSGYYRFFAQNDGDEKMDFSAIFHVEKE